MAPRSALPWAWRLPLSDPAPGLSPGGGVVAIHKAGSGRPSTLTVMANYVAGYTYVAELTGSDVDRVTLDSVREDLNSAVEWVIVENLSGNNGPDIWVRADNADPDPGAEDNTVVPAGQYRAIRPVHNIDGTFTVRLVGDSQRYQVRSL